MERESVDLVLTALVGYSGLKPTINAISDNGESYIGYLYAGLMIKDNDP